MFRRAAPSNNPSAGRLAGIGLTLFGLPFLLAGLFMTGMYLSGYLKWWNARNWQEVPCWIDLADLKVGTGESTTHRTVASYRYHFGGRDYTGDRVSFHGGSDNIGSFQKDAYREISAHADATSPRPFRCYVNPQRPSESVLYRTLRWPMQAFFAIFALTFPAVGAGVVLAGLFGVREAKQLATLRLAHPDEPWKWNSNWTGSSIAASTAPSESAMLAYAVWFWLIVAPLILAMNAVDAFRQDKSAYLVLILAGIGIVLTLLVLRRNDQRKQLGKTALELSHWPASPGSEMRGDVRIERQPAARGDVELTLSCEQFVTQGSGEDSSTVWEAIWGARREVPLDSIKRDINGYRIPVVFEMPSHLPASTIDRTDPQRYQWNLSLKFPGSPIRTAFEIPVIHTAASATRPPTALAEVARVEASAADLPWRLARSGIEATFDSAGRPLSVNCPPARHRSMIGFFVVFNAFWTAAAVFLIHQNAPLIFQLFWPITATAIWVSVLWMSLYQRRVDVEITRLVITHRFAVIRWQRIYQKQEIAGFSQDSNMSSGNQNYHRVRLESVNGKKVTLADGISESITAMGLVSSFENWQQSQG